MSLFTRTSVQVDQLGETVDQLENSSQSLSERKAVADNVDASLAELQPIVGKLVSKAEAGERDPNKRIYGASMVAKIFNLRDRFETISSKFSTMQSSLLEEWNAHQNEKREEENRLTEIKQREEQQRLEEQREKERREEEERVQRERARKEALRLEAEEAARLKAEQERLVEQKRLDEERIAREKRLEEERAAAEAKKREEDARAAAAAAEIEKAQAQKNSSISLSIRTTRGETYTLSDVPPNATVGHVKETIEKEHGMSKSGQRLIFQGRLLVNENTIDTYKIKDGSAIHLVQDPRSSSAASGSASEKLLVPAGTICHLKNGKQQFEDILKQCGTQRLVVVDWFAPWCGPCRVISPAFERLATRFSDVTFIKVDTEETPSNAQLAAEKHISAYPTFHFILNQTLQFSFSGANASAIESNIKKYRAMTSAGGSSSSPSGSNSFTGAGSSSQANSGGGRGPISSRVMSALLSLKQNISMTEFIVAVRTLLTFVRNMVNNPNLEKYRRVRTSNSTFQTRLGSKQGGIACMEAFGFEERTENGEKFLLISAEAASQPELRTVMTQLESALSQATGTASSPSVQAPRSDPIPPGGGPDGGATPGFGAGLAGMFGGGGMGMPNEAMMQLMQDPSFQQVASEISADPEAMGVIMQMQQAMNSGDFQTIQRLRSHPAMARLQATLSNSPAFLNTMMQQMAEQGFPNLGMPGGGGGLGGNVGGAGPNAQGTNRETRGENIDAPQVPSYPGAPMTAEEEERLLQEAIRLSMQDQAEPPKREEDHEGKDDSNDK